MDPLRCTVVDAVNPRTAVDLDVYGPSGSTLSDVAVPLLAASGLPPDRVLRVAGADVDPRCRVGTRPLVDGVLFVAAPPGSVRPPVPPTAALQLAVVGGPDAGRVLHLLPGHHVVGRSADASLWVDDADLSRWHLALTVTAQGVHVHDLGSSNGTLVDGTRVGASGARLRPGQRVVAGSSTLSIRLQRRSTAPTTADGGGRLLVQRGDQRSLALPDVVLTRAPEPDPAPPGRVPWIAVLAPLLLSVPLALLLRQPTYLLFGLLGPTAMLGTALSDRVGRRRERRSAHDEWRRKEVDVQRKVEAALAVELDLRRRATPDPAQLAEAAAGPTRDLWQRRASEDQLDVAIGTGTVTSGVLVRSGDGDVVQPLADAPVVVRLGDGHLAVTGEGRRVDALVRWVLLQLAVLAPPSAVRLAVVRCGRENGETDWARWLPQASSTTLPDLEAEVRRRLDTPTSAPPEPRLVALVHQVEAGAADPAVELLLEAGATVGVHVVCTASSARQLPAACTTVVSLPERGRSRFRNGCGPDVDDLVADGVSPGWADTVARALAPLREACLPGGQELAPHVLLAPLLALEAGGADLGDRWRRRPRCTAAVLGVGADGPVVVDLVRDGPHALVAGTTGAGKSELLQTLVASLAAANRPDELAFVLVDYKGGSAFRSCAALPHVTGVVTDLDERLAARALASLQAELTRRERLLADAAAADISTYQALRDADPRLPRLGRLVIVIDEFRLLASELPALLEGLVRLAAVGRSLGVHLVLATQRPAGIVSADIRANVNLRICLRVRDRSDSHDVLDAPDAAMLPEGRPGRALLRTGAGPVTAVQVALATGPGQSVQPDHVTVRRAGQPWTAPLNTGDQLQELVLAATAAAAELGAVPSPSPWLLPLPDHLSLDGLADEQGDGKHAIGLVDRPQEGTQPLLRWDPRTASHLAISGTARTGRSAALLAVVTAAILADPEVHVHVVSPAGGSLSAALDDVSQVGTLITADQPRAVHRLVTRLAAALGTRTGGAPTLLVLDGWETVVQQLEQVQHGRAVDDLLALVRDGESAGLRLLVAGGRGVLTSRLASLVAERLVLRCADPTDLLLAGASSATPPSHQPPGRGLHLPAGDEVQLAWPGDSEQARRRLVRQRRPSSPPLRLQPLPRRLRLQDLPPAKGQAAVVIGAGADDARVLELDVAGLVAVVGPPGSGRSSTLRLISQQLLRRGVDVVGLTPPAGTSAVHDTSPGRHDGAPHSPRRRPGAVVLVDDADLLPSSVVDEALASGAPVVLATTTASLAGAWTGWAATLRRSRTGVLLGASSAHDGEPFGIRAEPPDHRVPGRGQLVVRGVAVDVQVALPSGKHEGEG